ncbi:MAG TPA: hypothetical protein PL063_09000 [Candidatus Cloacimonadota bacterium]|nr:hypothetical protein [Candidatus Cloacimonadota bacterium]HQB41881.1 hypothetical protein [Candidatus Cloacimonadota bacterium]
MKKTILILFLLIIYSLNADFIIPKEDQVYDFLEMTNTLGYTNIDFSITPIYYQTVIDHLTKVANSNKTGYYKQQAKTHLNRLGLLNKNGFDTALSPISEIPHELFSSFTSHNKPKRLFTYGDGNTTRFKKADAIADETSLFISGMLGYKYDMKYEKDDDFNRNRQYYGVETAGNFSKDFGYYLYFKKGGWRGDDSFIEENPELSKMGNGYYKQNGWYSQVDMISELDFKNKYLNLSMGYGAMQVGYSITSPIILNSTTTPYGYVKYNKKIGDFSYTGFTAQLIPDSLKVNEAYDCKSYALQTISYSNPHLTIGVGNAVVYGNNTINLAYSSPLAIYKIMDNKYHGWDNGIIFGYANMRAMKGLSFYGNFYADDLTKSRLKTKYFMTFLAFQGGMKLQLEHLPLEIAGEATAVGPGCYSHKSKTYMYTNDDRILGSEHGSNYLSFAGRARLSHSWCSLAFFYENIQQGDKANNPYNSPKTEFLADNIERHEVFKTELALRLTQELSLKTEYQYHHLKTGEKHYVLNTAEYKF